MNQAEIVLLRAMHYLGMPHFGPGPAPASLPSATATTSSPASVKKGGGAPRQQQVREECWREEEERFYSPFGGDGAYWTQNSVSHARQRI